MDDNELLKAVMGWVPNRRGYLGRKRERRTLRRLLDMGSAYAAILAQQGEVPTARQMYLFLGCKYDMDAIEVYLCQQQCDRYLTALRREPSIFRLGLEFLDSTEEPGRSAEVVEIAQEVEDMQRVYRGDPNARGGMQ